LLAALVQATKTSSNEFVFKVALKGRRGIWRSIALRGDETLERLHEEIFRAFDRYDDHLYSFYFPKVPRRRGPILRHLLKTPQMQADPNAVYYSELNQLTAVSWRASGSS
jgi:hypothetical protein